MPCRIPIFFATEPVKKYLKIIQQIIPLYQAYLGQTIFTTRSRLRNASPLVWDLVLVILDHVVSPTPLAQETVANDADHVLRGLLGRGGGLEAGSEELDCVAAETRESSVEHQCHESNYVLLVGADGEVSLHTELHEPLQNGERLHDAFKSRAGETQKGLCLRTRASCALLPSCMFWSVKVRI